MFIEDKLFLALTFLKTALVSQTLLQVLFIYSKGLTYLFPQFAYITAFEQISVGDVRFLLKHDRRDKADTKPWFLFYKISSLFLPLGSLCSDNLYRGLSSINSRGSLISC